MELRLQTAALRHGCALLVWKREEAATAQDLQKTPHSRPEATVLGKACWLPWSLAVIWELGLGEVSHRSKT